MTALITDDPAVADMPWAADIEDVVRVEVQHGSTSADEIEQTNLARLFAVAGQWLETARDPFWPVAALRQPGPRLGCSGATARAIRRRRRAVAARDDRRSITPPARRLRPRRIACRDASLCRPDIAVRCLPWACCAKNWSNYRCQTDHGFGPIRARVSAGRASPAGPDRRRTLRRVGSRPVDHAIARWLRSGQSHPGASTTERPGADAVGRAGTAVQSRRASWGEPIENCARRKIIPCAIARFYEELAPNAPFARDVWAHARCRLRGAGISNRRRSGGRIICQAGRPLGSE